MHRAYKFRLYPNKLQKELLSKNSSSNYNRCKKKLAILYSKLKNARNYYLHNITKKIIDEYDIITCEKLKVKNMLQEHKLAKKISDASSSEIIRQLSYKCKYKHFYQIDTYYSSSQICNVCGNRDNTYKDLSKRKYKCKHCHNEMDRDLNASLNIMYEGLKYI